MKEQIINSFNENKVLYWLLGFLLAVMIAFYNNTQTVRNERLEKIESEISQKVSRSYVDYKVKAIDDKFKTVDEKINHVDQASNAAIERITKRQDEILSKINDIYIILLKERDDKN